MSRNWNTGTVIAAAAVLVLALSGALRLLNVVIWRMGGVGALIAVFALAYIVIRKLA